MGFWCRSLWPISIRFVLSLFDEKSYLLVRPIRSTLSTSLHPDSLDRDHEVRIRWDERIPTHVSDARNDSSTFMINSSNSPDYHEESIFISIASFRDSELKYTLRDIFLQAQYPTRIFVGIILQIYDTDEDQELYGYDQIYSSTFFPSSCHYNDDILSILQTNIRVLRINAEDSRGPCWARSSAQSLWKDEKYYLQIDSHMRFRKYYDSYLIHIYKQCEEEILSSNSPLRFHFPVISTYPLDYSLDETCSLSDIRSTILV